MRFARHAWWLYLALMVPISVAYLAGPLNSGPVFNVLGFGASAAIVVGVRIHRPSAPWAWYLIAMGQFMLATGDVLAYNYRAFFGATLPFPSVADIFYLAVYPLTVAGLLLLIRRRNPGRDWASLVDSLIVTIGLALVSWLVLIAPYAHDLTMSLGSKLVSVAYPLGDILMLGVAVRMAVGGGRRSPAYYMVIAGIAAVLVTDSVYGWIQLHGSYTPGDPLDGGWIAYYLLWGAAALHPSMAAVSHASARRAELTRTRILGIAAAVFIAPVIEMVQAPGDGRFDAIVVGVAAIVLFGLVVVRMIGLARVLEITAKRETTMRRAVDALVTATNADEIIGAAQAAATVLARAEVQPTLLAIEERDGGSWLVGPDPRRATAELSVALAALATDVIDQLVRRVPAEIPDRRALLGPDAYPAPAFLVPIIAHGRLAGVIALLDATAEATGTRQSLESLAAQVGIALDSAALTEHVLRGKSEARLTALVQHSTDVIVVLAEDATVEYASPSIQAILGYDETQLVAQQLSEQIPEEDRGVFQSAFEALLAHAVGSAEAVEFRVRHRDGRLLYTECRMTNLLDDPAVRGVVVNLRDMTERNEFERQLTHQAFHDPVTGLANHALFRDRVGHALSRRNDHSEPLAVLFLDLDDFKTINDTFGHVTADRLLRTISKRIGPALRMGDTVARLGGDEFGILLEDIEHEADVSEIVERLLAAIRLPYALDDRDVSVQGSIGIAVARSNDDAETVTTVDELLRNADDAMYQAKGAGGDTYRYFKAEMHEAVVEALELRNDLKAAIAAEELTLAYQPIFDLATDEISGYEALLRWNHERRGSVPPATFIPVAEDSGLIVALGAWVLKRACHDAVAFARATPGARTRTVGVNVSGRQLQRAEIVDEVRDALSASGLEPSYLVLEITETMFIDDLELAIDRLNALRGLGILVALDDFGSGYSSLNYIRRLPLNILKIDKHFIDSVDRGDQDGELTAAIVGMARVLELQCVAEGVERIEQYDRLKQLGCDYAQGFLMARPVSADVLHELLRAQPHAVVGASVR